VTHQCDAPGGLSLLLLAAFVGLNQLLYVAVTGRGTAWCRR
jgi:hypothetical protein